RWVRRTMASPSPRSSPGTTTTSTPSTRCSSAPRRSSSRTSRRAGLTPSAAPPGASSPARSSGDEPGRMEGTPAVSEPAETAPPLEFRALRLLDHGWGAGWAIRPGPSRRHWMDANLHTYKCLPLVIANQWGWQVLCPTDVVVSWDGSPGLDGLRIDV